MRGAAICPILFALVWTLHAAAENDWLIVPGERVGPITATTTRADLVRIFGRDNVMDQDVSITDAGPEPGTVLFLQRPEESITITWKERQFGARIYSLFFCLSQLPDGKFQTSCRWHTADGIGFMTSLPRLEKMNGRPFELLGFDWDYGGTVMSWKGGKLERLDAKCGGLALRVNPSSVLPPNATQRSQIGDVSGDRHFSSAHAGLHAAHVEVDFMSFGFSGCRE